MNPKYPLRLPFAGTAPLPTHRPRGWARRAASGSWPTHQTHSPHQGMARAAGEAEALVPIARLYWFLDSVAGGSGLEPVPRAPGAGEGQGWGGRGCTGCCAWGKALSQPKAVVSLPGMGAGRSIRAQRLPRASHAHAPMSRSTCLGSPEERGAGPGGREDPGANHVSRKGGPFPQGCLCSRRRGGSKEKSREKQVLGPVSGELSWRQVRELNHIVKELHGPHDVLILRGGGGKQAVWAQSSNLGSSPQTWLYPHGSSDPCDQSSRDYRQFPSSTGMHGSPHPHRDAGTDMALKAEPQHCPLEPCLYPFSARRVVGGRRSPRDREVTQPPSRAASGFTFWQDSRNSSIVTTPSLFRSIFCRQAQHGGHGRDSPSPRESPACPAQVPQGLDTVHPCPSHLQAPSRTRMAFSLPGSSTALLHPHCGVFSPAPCQVFGSHSLCAGALLPEDMLSSPGRSSPRAPGVLPPAWLGRCICPSCRRWTS